MSHSIKRFAVTAQGSQLTVKRIDVAGAGWGMQLRFACIQHMHTLTHCGISATIARGMTHYLFSGATGAPVVSIGNSPSNSKTVTVPPGYTNEIDSTPQSSHTRS